MKTIISIILLLTAFTEVQAQDKFFTKSGYAKFYSEAPLENIEAVNNKVQSIIDMQKQDVVISMPMTAFQFEKSLMQEHFNENYIESEKFPSAEFDGYFTGKDRIDLSKSGAYEVIVKGNMTIHGVTKSISTKGTIEVDGKTVTAKAVFMIKVADYDIDIPTIVFKNIAEEVEVTVALSYLPFKS